MVARNADRGGQRQKLRTEAKRINVLLRAHRDLIVDIDRGVKR